jgi:hypothetical protein
MPEPQPTTNSPGGPAATHSNGSTRAGWRSLGKQIRRRLIDPCANPNFIFYFFLFVVVLSGVGLWITVIRYFTSAPNAANDAARNVFENAATYSLAISMTALADIILAKGVLNSFKMCNFGFMVIVSICFAISFAMPPAGFYTPAWAATSLGIVICWVQWWMINAGNPTLEDDPYDPSDVTGGDPLSGLPGQAALGNYRT